MCGICVLVYQSTYNSGQDLKGFKPMSLQRRGPDCCRNLSKTIAHDIDAVFCGTVLHFRGLLTAQPLESNGNILLWNGEVFSGLKISADINDTQHIMNKLCTCHSDSDILHVFGSIQGPWACIFWQESQKKLWFGRDILGRRSLLWNISSASAVISLSSVQLNEFGPWSEVPAVGLYCMELESREKSRISQSINLYPWIRWNPQFTDRVVNVDSVAELCNSRVVESLPRDVPCVSVCDVGVMCDIPSVSAHFTYISSEQNIDLADDNVLYKHATASHLQAADKLLSVLSDAVCIRVKYQDSKCHVCLLRQRNADDLYSLPIPSSSCTTIDSAISVISKRFAADLSQETRSNCSLQPSFSCDVKMPCNCETVSDILSSTREPLCRDSTQHFHRQTVVPESVDCNTTESCGHTRVAVLFSGGIDSLVLAALADRFVVKSEPIDLLNVAFEQQNSGPSAAYDVPDRRTGECGLNELRRLSPHRQWNFVEINVTLNELQSTRSSHIVQLILPLSTVLDDSIGCALWFAARGKGSLRGLPYTTTARVVLAGMGADEQLAGYSRHRTRFSEEGWPGLVEEIQMELDRISFRNLGRDDRVISDHGRELRAPFLDENVVRFLCSLPMPLKANLSLARGVGDKFLLRLVAARLGLSGGALLPKRAIQFGSRIAKAERTAERASDVCHRLQSS